MMRKILLLTFVIILCGTASVAQNISEEDYTKLLNYVACKYTVAYIQSFDNINIPDELDNISIGTSLNETQLCDLFENKKNIKRFITDYYSNKNWNPDLSINDLNNNLIIYEYGKRHKVKFKETLIQTLCKNITNSVNNKITKEDSDSGDTSPLGEQKNIDTKKTDSLPSNEKDSQVPWLYFFITFLLCLLFLYLYKYRKKAIKKFISQYANINNFKKIKFNFLHIHTNPANAGNAKTTTRTEKMKPDKTNRQKKYKTLKLEYNRLEDLHTKTAKENEQLRRTIKQLEQHIRELGQARNDNEQTCNDDEHSNVLEVPRVSIAEIVTQNISCLYANAIIDGVFNRVTSFENEDTVYTLLRKTPTNKSAEFTVDSRYYNRVIACPDLLDGCDTQRIRNNPSTLTVEPGNATQDDLGKWKITKKAKIKFT
jgi:hypothetical protein